MKNNRKTKKSSSSIFVKLFSMSMMFVIIPALLISTISLVKFAEVSQNNAISYMSNSINNKLKILEEIINGQKSEAYAIAQDTFLNSVVGNLHTGASTMNEADQKVMNDYLKSFSDFSNGLYEGLFCTDSNGTIITDSLEGKMIGANLSDRAYFTQARDAKEIIVSDTVKSSATGNPIIVIAVPVLSKENEFAGVLGITIDYLKLTEHLIQRDAKEKYNYTIINNEGLIIAHENRDLVFQTNLNEEGESSKALFEKMVKESTSYGFYNLDGSDKVMAFTKYSENNWYIGCAINKDDYYSQMYKQIWTNVMIGLICIVISVFFVSFFSRTIANPLKSLSQIAEAIASGDLTKTVPQIKSKDEIGKLTNAFSEMTQRLRNVISEVRDMSESTATSSEQMMASADEISNSSDQIALAINELAKNASDQANSTEQGNYKIVEVISGIKEISVEMSESINLAETAQKTVAAGKDSVHFQSIKMNENKDVVSSVSEAIKSLNEKSKEIGDILTVIMGISEQTNLLSLNAAIEAARAGEQGRGFAVVAGEIGKLAEQSSQSVNKIDTIIREVQTGVQNTVNEMEKVQVVTIEQESALADTIKAFHRIEEVVSSINMNIIKVSEVSKQMDIKAKEAGDAISDIASFSEETASGTEEVAASTQEQAAVTRQIAEASKNLTLLASELQKNMEVFNI